MKTKAQPKQLNEYHIVRVNKPVAGVAGEDMKHDDPRRIRYYVQAETEWGAMASLRERFSNDTLAVVKTIANVQPHFKEAA